MPIPGAEFNLFKPLRRHLRAARDGLAEPCAPESRHRERSEAIQKADRRARGILQEPPIGAALDRHVASLLAMTEEGLRRFRGHANPGRGISLINALRPPFPGSRAHCPLGDAGVAPGEPRRPPSMRPRFRIDASRARSGRVREPCERRNGLRFLPSLVANRDISEGCKRLPVEIHFVGPSRPARPRPPLQSIGGAERRVGWRRRNWTSRRFPSGRRPQEMYRTNQQHWQEVSLRAWREELSFAAITKSWRRVVQG